MLHQKQLSKEVILRLLPPLLLFKDVVPRIGGLMDLQAITDVIDINGDKFVRPIYAGNALCTVSTKDSVKLLTIRSTNFEKVAAGDSQDLPTESVECDSILSE
jgi:electron transfer flavoprotein alpha subunit